jgi:hypothetical protein
MVFPVEVYLAGGSVTNRNIEILGSALLASHLQLQNAFIKTFDLPLIHCHRAEENSYQKSQHD